MLVAKGQKGLNLGPNGQLGFRCTCHRGQLSVLNHVASIMTLRGGVAIRFLDTLRGKALKNDDMKFFSKKSKKLPSGPINHGMVRFCQSMIFQDQHI